MLLYPEFRKCRDLPVMSWSPSPARISPAHGSGSCPCSCSGSEYSSALPDRVAKPPFANGRQSSGQLNRAYPSSHSRSNVIPSSHGCPLASAASQHRLVALEEPRLRPAQRVREPPEQLGVRHRFAARRDRRAIQREIQMAPCGRQVQMLDLARGRQHVVGVERGIRDEQVVHDGEQVLAQEPLPNRGPDSASTPSDSRRTP